VDQVKHLKKKSMAMYLVYSHLAFILPGQLIDATLEQPGDELLQLRCTPVGKPANGELYVSKHA